MGHREIGTKISQSVSRKRITDRIRWKHNMKNIYIPSFCGKVSIDTMKHLIMHLWGEKYVFLVNTKIKI